MHSVNMSITSFASYISLVKRVYQTLLEAWPWDIRKLTKTSRYKPLKQSAIWVYQKSSRAKSVLAVFHDLAFYNSFIDFELKMLLLLYQMKRLISNKWSSIYFSYFKVFSNCILHIVNSTNRFNIAPRHFINRSQNVLCVKTKKNATDILPHFDVLCDLLLYRTTITVCFMRWKSTMVLIVTPSMRLSSNSS